MGQKKVFWRHHSFRPFFGNWSDYGFILRGDNTWKNRAGFTLIELIVVIGVISILAAMVLAVLNPTEQFKKANDARKKSDLSQISKALEAYYENNGTYPTSDSNGLISGVAWGANWQPYMNQIPKSPSGSYAYKQTGGDTYYLYASLERTGDSSLCNSDGSACPNSTGLNCGGVCNYGISSPNVSP